MIIWDGNHDRDDTQDVRQAALILTPEGEWLVEEIIEPFGWVSETVVRQDRRAERI
jgi:hypothetical protein